MNHKGLYTSAIGILIILLISANIFVFLGNQKNDSSGISNSIIEVKLAWHKTALLLDDAYSTSLYSYPTAANACSVAEPSGMSEILTWKNMVMQDVTVILNEINNSFGESITCQIEDYDITFLTPEVTFNCTKTSPEGIVIVDYKKTISFEKELFAVDDLAGGCFVDVLDVQSNHCQIDEIIGSGCGT